MCGTVGFFTTLVSLFLWPTPTLPFIDEQKHSVDARFGVVRGPGVSGKWNCVILVLWKQSLQTRLQNENMCSTVLREWVTGEKYIHIHCYLVPSVTWREESHLTTAILEKYLIGEGRSTSSPAFCQGRPTLHNATPQHTGQVNVMKEIVSLMQFQSSSWNFEPPQLFHLLFRCNLNSKKMAWRSHASSCRLMIIK